MLLISAEDLQGENNIVIDTKLNGRMVDEAAAFLRAASQF